MPELKKILIIDDEKGYYDNLYFNAPQIKTLVYTENEGLQQLEADLRINFIILDLALEGGNNFQEGLPFLQQILVCTKYEIPVMVVTQDNSVDTYRDALNLGASGFMHKSGYEPKALELEIQKILDDFHNWKPQSADYNNVFYKKTAELLPYNVEQVIEFLRHHPNQQLLIHEIPGAGKHFWIKHILDEFYKDRTPIYLDLSAVTQRALNDPGWYILPFVTEPIPPGSLAYYPNVQYIVTGLDSINQKMYEKLLDLLKTYPNTIFVSSNNLRSLRGCPPEFRGMLIATAIEFQHIHKIEDFKVEELINYFLSLPSVCPLTSPFLGKLASTIFEPNILQLVKEHRYASNVRGLRETIQYIIYQADRRINNTTSQIGETCLPASLLQKHAPVLALPKLSTDEIEAQKYTATIEQELKSAGLEPFTPEKKEKIEEKLSAYHDLFPHLFNHTESERVCKAFNFKEGL